MKSFKVMLILLSLIITAQSFADCREVAMNKKASYLGATESAQFWGAGATYVAVALTFSMIPAIPAAFAAPGAYVLIANLDNNRFIKLINQSENYLKSPENSEPGRLLARIHRKIENKLDSVLSVRDVA